MKVLDMSNLFFYLGLIFISVFLLFIDISFINEFIFYIVFFNIIVDLLFKFLIEKFDKGLVILKTFLSSFIRLFFSIIFILLFHFYGIENLLNFILNFLIVYLLFIIFEITILLLNLHHIK